MSTQIGAPNSEFLTPYQRGFSAGLLAAAAVCLVTVLPAELARQRSEEEAQTRHQRERAAVPLDTLSEWRRPHSGSPAFELETLDEMPPDGA